MSTPQTYKIAKQELQTAQVYTDVGNDGSKLQPFEGDFMAVNAQVV